MNDGLRNRSLLFFLLTLGFVASAPAELIVDGGFENTVVGPATAVAFAPGQTIGGAWLVLGDPGTHVVLGSSSYVEPNHPIDFNVHSGLNALDLTGFNNQGPSVGVQQTASTQAGVVYVLSFYLGRGTMIGGPAWPYKTASTAYVSINGGARIAFTNSDVTEGEFDWKQFTYSFTASGSATTIAIYNGSDSDNNAVLLDDVSLTAAVPEPSSALSAFLGAALLSAALWKRSGRSSNNPHPGRSGGSGACG